MSAERSLTRLHAVLATLGPVAVAVSGGIDSLALGVAAHRQRPRDVGIFHAVSAAVPAEATARVETLARAEGWRLHLIDAGEFDEDRYVANPVDRCFHCKRSLYSTVSRHTSAQVLSGANTDDLGDYRPGLDAARAAGVRHPLIEADIDKSQVRSLAALLGLGALAELPSSPCLSSRVETGIAIVAPMLRGIDRVERFLRETVDAQTVRCRVRARGIVIELDDAALQCLSDQRRAEIAKSVQELLDLGNDAGSSVSIPVFASYERGSAFVGKPS